MIKLIEENILFQNGYKSIAGIDEAGRGPLAGPVVAACVMCTEEINKVINNFCGVNDSKKLISKKREEMYSIIMKSDLKVGIGICDHDTIDRINILQATFLAMKKAIGAVRNKPEIILVDGNKKIPNISIEQRFVVRGDENVFLIAAASIIAKVTRDRIMQMHDVTYPEYNFKTHKGYGTKEHLHSIGVYGICNIHRKSFEPIKTLLSKEILVNKK